MLSLCFLFFLLLFVIPGKSKKFSSSRATLLRAQTPKVSGNVSIEHLPPDLVSNILSRLPARELLKCKRVCTSWFDLITDPYFTTNYYAVHNSLARRRGQEEHLLVIRRPFLSSLKTYISVLSSDANKPEQPVSSVLLNPPPEYDSDHRYWTEIMGPCNGVYFLEGNPNVMMNPSLRQFKALPESRLASPHGTYSLTDYAGFGFDPKTNDFKVVVIRDLWSRETDERRPGYWTAELYSLNSNSWRKLEAAVPLPVEIWGSSRVYTAVNNCCHWWGYVGESGRRNDVVLAFDMGSQVFRKIKVPRIRDSPEEALATLAPFDGSAAIGVIVCPVREKEKRYDVWVMEDYWDEGSWVKRYSVGPIEGISRLVGFYGSNRFLWKDSDGGLVMYEPDSEQINGLQVYGKNDSLRGARYMESLVSLLRGNEFSRQCVSSGFVPDPLLNQRE